MRSLKESMNLVPFITFVVHIMISFSNLKKKY